MRVFVYFNLHRKVWSIKALDGEHAGRVIAHATHCTLENVRMRVSEAGRQRVLREQRKNVHAGLVGDLRSMIGEARFGGYGRYFGMGDAWSSFAWYQITYNPYKAATFTRRDDGSPIYRASRAVLGKGFVDVQL